MLSNIKGRRSSTRLNFRALPSPTTECYNVSGNFDYLLKVHSPNMKQYQQFLLNDLGSIESVGDIESTFVMDEVKHEYGIHL